MSRIICCMNKEIGRGYGVTEQPEVFITRVQAMPLLVLALTLLGGVTVGIAMPQPPASHTIYLPLVQNGGQSILGYETILGNLGSSQVVRSAARDLGATWLRLNGVRWSALQPTPDATYNWNHPHIIRLKSDLAAARDLGLTPTVIVRGTPLWATDTGKECGVVNEASLPAYTAFMEALAAHFGDQVTYWEIGNEPDVDPSLVPGDSMYGCYGNIGDPYYGGEQYGRMLQAAATGLRRGNAMALIVMGGLLLDRPETTNPAQGKPERFFEGVLRTGAASSFDILAYHAYPIFIAPSFDTDINTAGRWDALGGHTIGKLKFLREVMERYGVQKPIWLNETGLIASCVSDSSCGSEPAPEGFEQAQAEHLVRSFSRAAANGAQQYIWYTLDSNGWRHSSMLRGGTQERKPVYYAYDHLVSTVEPYYRVEQLPASVYGSEVEAYRFFTRDAYVDALWRNGSGSSLISMPGVQFVSASDLFGASLTPSMINGQAQFRVGSAPIYIRRTS